MRAGVTVALVAAATATALIELMTRSYARYGVEALLTALALAYVWARRERLRPLPTMLLALALPIAILVAHLLRGVHGDIDTQEVYPAQGDALLHGHYPHSEYPPLGVFLFGLERALGNIQVANGLVMALCHAVVVACILALRTREAPFVAAAVAVWPLNSFFWEFKYDLLPTALLVLGLLAAYRARWSLAGVALAAGTLAKWTPAVSFVLLVAWLLASRRREDALRLAAAFALPLVAVVVSLALWDADAAGSAWSRQAPRHITPESLWYLVLAPLGRASAPGAVYAAADVPGWANQLAVALQLALLAALAALVVVRAPPLPSAVAIAALGPAVFLLSNKIFSAQFIVTIAAAVAFAAAIAARGRSLLATLALLALATGFNLLVYPIGRYWHGASALMFLCAAVAVALIAAEAARNRILTNGGYPLRS